ncbi:MAG: sigma 54-interacting transcriptional regulator [Sporomusaceae bacterium]|nr:sigma 54-interacting transcriptional regulator [Sporomusaceae bacterium]
MAPTFQNIHQVEGYLSYNQITVIIEQSYDGILVIDSQATVVLVNDAYCRSTHIKREDIIQRNFREVWSKRVFSAAILEALDHKKSTTRIHYDMSPGKVIMVTANPVFDDDGNISFVIGNCRDMTELAKLREDLEHERNKVSGPIAASPNMKQLLFAAEKVASVDVTVLITGESGVGKEVVARYIHDQSRRSQGPFVAVNCGAIPENLLESEFFGYTNGAFTGARKNGKKGLFETAHGGTLFLDEIGDLPFNLQVKLLRALDTGRITKIGDSQELDVDVRILAATNKNLKQMVSEQKFREDLYYRLNVIHLQIPALRERQDDIRSLCIYFLNLCNERYGQNKKLDETVLELLIHYDWPGNVRQLRHVIERMVVMSRDDIITLEGLSDEITSSALLNKAAALPGEPITLHSLSIPDAVAEIERKIFQQALQSCHSSRAIAKITGINQSTVLRKMKKYGFSIE